MSTLRCLKMRFSVNSPSMSSSTLGCVSQNAAMSCDQLLRQILVHAAEAEILGVHAAARGALVEHHQLLALLEAPQRRRQRADVHRLRRDVEQVREQASDLGIEHADQLAALAAPPVRAASPPRGRTRAPGSSARRSRGGRNSRCPAGRCGFRSASRCRDGGGRCAGRRASPPRRRAPAPGASTPCAAGCCGPKLMLNERMSVSGISMYHLCSSCGVRYGFCWNISKTCWPVILAVSWAKL